MSASRVHTICSLPVYRCRGITCPGRRVGRQYQCTGVRAAVGGRLGVAKYTAFDWAVRGLLDVREDQREGAREQRLDCGGVEGEVESECSEDPSAAVVGAPQV